MPRQGQFKSKHRVDERGRECSDPKHEGVRYLPWDEFYKTLTGHKGREPRCKKCRSKAQRTRDAEKKAKVAPAKRDDTTWDIAGANAFLMRK